MAAAGTGIAALQAHNQAKYQSKLADRNAAMENEAARDSIDQAKIENQQLARKYAAIKGRQQVAMAANGIDTSFGSAAQLAQDTAMFQAEDTAALYKNQYERTRGFDINAANYTAEARAKRQAATGALVKGAFDIGSTVLDGAQQYAGLKAKMGGPKLAYDFGGM